MVFALLPAAMAQDLKVIPLKWSDYAPPSAGGNVFMKQEWVPRVNEQIAKIGYKLDITYYHAASLYKQKDQVQALEDGLIDITTFVPSYEIARAPLHELVTFPLMGWNCFVGSRVWFELNEAVPEFGTEFLKYKELFHWMPMPGVLNANKVLRVPADFKGVKIQSSGMMMDLFRSVGAVPIRQSPTDWYTSLERGLIEAISTGIYSITMFKLQEVVKVHIIPTGDAFGFPSIAAIMNRKKFESLPPGVQKAIDDQVQWASEKLNVIDDAENPKALELCRKLGHTIIELTPEEMKLWYAAVKPMQEKWIEEMEAKGLPGRKVFEEAKRLGIKYKKQ
jgi:TRAP-type C4-dicarboxylate transport system substrate-binding protein